MENNLPSESDKKVARVFSFCFGLCLFLTSFVGTYNTYLYQFKGIKTHATVLEIVDDKHSRNFLASDKITIHYSKDFYIVRVRFVDQQGNEKIQWTQVESDGKKDFNVAVGADVPFMYIPSTTRSTIGYNQNDWIYCILWNVIAIPFGIFCLWWALIKK